jgi:hypothetical protein
MIRVTLRQLRTETIMSVALLAVLAVLLALTGPHLAEVNNAFQSSCKAAGDCATIPNPVFFVDPELQTWVPLILTFMSAVVGLFFGAPLVARELETGTFRLAWTQSVTLRRWLAVKLTLVGLAAVLIGGLVTGMVEWWQSPLDAAGQNPFDPVNFGYHGVVPIGYAAFGFALGVTAGVLLRRTVAAMGATLVGFIAARLAVEHWVRPHFASPLHESLSILTTHASLSVQAPAGTLSLIPTQVSIPNAWILSTTVADKSGDALTSQDLLRACPALGQPLGGGSGPLPAAVHACLTKLSATFHTVATYQPASRFWPFQWAEMGIFLVGAVALCGFTYWWLRRQYA